MDYQIVQFQPPSSNTPHPFPHRQINPNLLPPNPTLLFPPPKTFHLHPTLHPNLKLKTKPSTPSRITLSLTPRNLKSEGLRNEKKREKKIIYT